MHAPILDLDEGIQEVASRLEAFTANPRLVSVYGVPHHGKSYLIKILKNYLEGFKNMLVYGFGGAADLSYFRRMTENNYPNSLYLFHCGWFRYQDSLLEVDPALLAAQVGKKINLNIGIYNPYLDPRCIEGDYDLIIRNPGSVIKGKV